MRKIIFERKGTILLICAALLLGVALSSCAYISAASAQDAQAAQSEKKIEVLRLTADIEVGEKITSAKFEKVSLPESDVWIGAISEPEQAIGKYSMLELATGSFLIPRYLSDKKISVEKEPVNVDGTDRGFSNFGYVVVTDYVKSNTGEDISYQLQKIINQNPQSVIYFPDGEYVISTPLRTSSAGQVSVSLKLSDNAVIKASDDWKGSDAMILLGGANEQNDINVPGSNYYLEGGIIDGNGKAKGVSIEHGRETSVRDVTIVDTPLGLNVKFGANNGSSDADIENIRIYGNGTVNSTGLLIQGWDNTFSNIYIANVQTGVKIETAANLLRDIHVAYVPSTRINASYNLSVGFLDRGDRNWFDNCTSEGFATGFQVYSSRSILSSCVVKWHDGQDSKQVAIATGSAWNSVARSCAAYFTAPKENCEYLVADNASGRGEILTPILDETRVNGELYKSYVKDALVNE